MDFILYSALGLILGIIVGVVILTLVFNKILGDSFKGLWK